MTDRDAFMDRISVDGDSLVGVNLDDRKGTRTDKVKFVFAIVATDKNLLSNAELVGATMAISAKKALINERLAMCSERVNVSDDTEFNQWI